MQRAMLCAWGAIVFLQINLVSRAENLPQEHAALSPPHLGVHIPADGVEFVFGSTNIYQQNVNGGMSTHRRAGRLSGSYDIEVIADLRRLLGLEGARVYVHTEGGYSKSGGINDVAAGSAFGVNGDAFGRDAIVVTELYFEQSLPTIPSCARRQDGPYRRLRMPRLPGRLRHQSLRPRRDASSSMPPWSTTPRFPSRTTPWGSSPSTRPLRAGTHPRRRRRRE